MGHENARNGIGKIFTAEVLKIIAAVCALATGIFAAITIGAAASESVAGVGLGGIGAVIFSVVGGIISIIAYILNLVGLNKAGQDNEQIKSAFMLAIIALIVGIIGGIVTSIVGTSYTWVSDIVQVISAIISLVITYKVLMGCAELNPALQDKANSVWKIVMCVIILDIVVIVVTIILGVMGITAVSAVAYLIVIILDFVFELIGYILFISFLAKARKEV